jgi:Na+-driven multidrug efflux pump
VTRLRLIRLAFPLTLLNVGLAFQTVVDRLTLAALGDGGLAVAAHGAAIAVAGPLSLLTGVSAALVVALAPLTGAGEPQRMQPLVYHALGLSCSAAIAVLALTPFTTVIVTCVFGHAAALADLEAAYLGFLLPVVALLVLQQVALAPFAAANRNWVLAAVQLPGACLLAVLDLVLVPRFGIVGAGAARLVSTSLSTAAALLLLMRSFARGDFGPAAWPRFDGGLCFRLVWASAVIGAQIFTGSALVSSFPLFLAQGSPGPLAATSVLFGLYFTFSAPCLALAQVVGSAVGRFLGESNPTLAERTVRHGLEMASLCAGGTAIAFLLGGEALLARLGYRAGSGETTAAVFGIAAFAVFDGIAVVLLNARRAAGRTTFVTVATLAAGRPLPHRPSRRPRDGDALDGVERLEPVREP